MTTQKHALLEAVNDLINEKDGQFKVTALEEVSRLSGNYPVQMSGEMATLNPLLGLMHDDPSSWDNVKKLIDAKRAVLGYEPLWPEPKKPLFKDRKNEYQRELMAKRRERAYRALALEDAQRGEHAALKGNPRLEFIKVTEANWGRMKNAEIEAARDRAGGHLKKAQIDAIRERVEAEIDAELTRREDRLRLELLKPPHQRQPV